MRGSAVGRGRSGGRCTGGERESRRGFVIGMRCFTMVTLSLQRVERRSIVPLGASFTMLCWEVYFSIGEFGVQLRAYWGLRNVVLGYKRLLYWKTKATKESKTGV